MCFAFGQGVGVTFLGDRPTSRNKLSPTHPACFIDISAMLQSNMADISLPRGREVVSLSEDNHDGLTTQDRAPLDPSIRLGGLSASSG